MSIYTWLPAIVISHGLVFCATKEWNERSVVKRTVNQHQNEPKPTNQTDQPTNNIKKEKNNEATKQTTDQQSN